MKHLLNFKNIEKQELEKLIDTTLKIETNTNK
jgi:ornithine carbamoyltransferase